jgi:hypothetical protein
MLPDRVIVRLEAVTNSCFVAMPFHALYRTEYELVIKPAIEKAGLVCVRGDEIYSRQAIVEDIWVSIRKARLVVAELSGRDPNVMYEIGLAHAIGKPIILITRNEEDVPFDLRSLRYVYYDINHPKWGDLLGSKLTQYVAQALMQTTLASHLEGVVVEATLPDLPTQPVAATEKLPVLLDLSGKWRGEWLSIKTSRRHIATLEIPEDHGPNFTATMTVTYERADQQSIVEETLTGSYRGASLSLTGVSYTYVHRGASAVYSLDRFELEAQEDGKSLVGKAVLQHGERPIAFVRQS